MAPSLLLYLAGAVWARGISAATATANFVDRILTMPAARSFRSIRRGATLLAVAFGAPALVAFVSYPGPSLQPRTELSRVAIEAEPSAAPSPAPSSSVSLVKINEADLNMEQGDRLTGSPGESQKEARRTGEEVEELR